MSEPTTSHCPNPADMGEYACTNKSQCWEPCGDLGHSEEHAEVVQTTLGELLAQALEQTEQEK